MGCRLHALSQSPCMIVMVKVKVMVIVIFLVMVSPAITVDSNNIGGPATRAVGGTP